MGINPKNNNFRIMKKYFLEGAASNDRIVKFY